MADVQHNTLTDPNIHEPKGASTATAGEVLQADGLGGTDWVDILAAVNNSNLMALTYKFKDISTASSQWVVCPLAGDVFKIYSVLHGVIATADTAISFEIAGTPITSGGLTIAFSGSAAGDIDSATPSAAKTVTAGQAIEIISDGASTNTVDLTITFLIDVT